MSVTQEDIAKKAGVSRGTVYRALNARGRIDPVTAQRIRKIAAEMGYVRTGTSGIFAKIRNPKKIGVVIQSVETVFMKDILEMIRFKTKDYVIYGVEILIKPMTQLDVNQQIQAINDLLAEGIDGLALTPIEDDRVADLIETISEKVPVVTFNTDLVGCGRLAYVGQDNYKSGRTAAGLMNMILPTNGQVLVVTGYINNSSHQSRIEGFISEFSVLNSESKILPIERCNDSNEVAYQIVLNKLKEFPNIKGIYFSASGQTGACKAIDKLGLKEEIRFICHDKTEENLENLSTGLIDFVLDQDAEEQAIRPLQILHGILHNDEKPKKEFFWTHTGIFCSYNI